MKPNKYNIDKRRTKLLNIPELLVLADRGDSQHFECIHKSALKPYKCPFCGSANIRNQGNSTRDYYHYLFHDDDFYLITVSLTLRKNKCMNPDCGHVFTPEISFASPYRRTTYKLEDGIVRMVLGGGYSYSEIARKLGTAFSRQVIGQIFNHRAEELCADNSSETKWFRKSGHDRNSYQSLYLDRKSGYDFDDFFKRR